MSTMLTEEQYLEIERQAETRSEFRDGEVFAMEESSRSHSHLSVSLSATLGGVLPPDCVAFSSNLRIRIAPTGQHTYPDCSAVRGECEPSGDFDFIENPILIAEVLSPSTEAYDRGVKFEAYQMIPSLREYLLFHQDRRRVEHFSKRDDGSWNLRISAGKEGQAVIPHLGVTIGIGELYEKIEGLE